MIKNFPKIDLKFQIQIKKFEFNACFPGKGCKLFKSETILGYSNFWLNSNCEAGINYPPEFNNSPVCSQGLLLHTTEKDGAISFIQPKYMDINTKPSQFFNMMSIIL